MPDREMRIFLEGVVGAVEANSFEQMCLWKEYTDRGESWVSKNSGLLETVGHLDGRPICISLLTAVVRGHKVLFWHATSQVVDYNKINNWLVAWLPLSAHDGKRVNKTDAMNFHNVFPRTAYTSGERNA